MIDHQVDVHLHLLTIILIIIQNDGTTPMRYVNFTIQIVKLCVSDGHLGQRTRIYYLKNLFRKAYSSRKDYGKKAMMNVKEPQNDFFCLRIVIGCADCDLFCLNIIKIGSEGVFIVC